MVVSKFLNPKNDLAFKRIFGTEKNKDILIHFLNDIFGRTTNPIEHVTFLKTSQEPEIAAQRASTVDVMCEDAEHNKFIIEMQVKDEPGFEHRAQYYAAKTYIEQREKGIAYKDLKEVLFLAITSYNLFPDKDEYLSHHQTLDIKTHARNLKDFSFLFLELAKFKKSKKELVTITEKWAYFFKNAEQTTEKDLNAIIGDDFIIKRAYEELNRFSWTPEELRIYDSIDMREEADKAINEKAFEEGIEKGKAEGKIEGEKIGVQKGEKIGVKKGTTETTRNIARTMKKIGIAVDKIAEATGLTAKEIKDL